jgi:excisionase family DNA binding protein
VTARLLTAHVVAERLGLSTETVLRWARAGDLPAIHLSNRAIRFPEDQLEAWLQERATPADRGSATRLVPAPPLEGMVVNATRPQDSKGPTHAR